MAHVSVRNSLFERLVPDAAPHGSLSRHDFTAQRIDAIKSHLERLLNARLGCSQSAPGLGLIDFNDSALGSADLLVQISADIRRAIAAFEPRIRVLEVHFHPDPDLPLELNFRLDCGLQVDEKEQQVQIDLIMNGRDRYTHVK
jgi:type VI secretion system protein